MNNLTPPPPPPPPPSSHIPLKLHHHNHQTEADSDDEGSKGDDYEDVRNFDEENDLKLPVRTNAAGGINQQQIPNLAVVGVPTNHPPRLSPNPVGNNTSSGGSGGGG